MKNNHEPLDHAILVLSQMETDLHRIAIQSDEAVCALIGDCAEHRIAMLNKLRHIKQQWNHEGGDPIITPDQITRNALEGTPTGDPEIAPESQSKREPSALAQYRRRQRWANRLAWMLATAAALAIITAIRFAFRNL